MGRKTDIPDRRDDLEVAIERLYQLPLEAFVAARNRLGTDLRKAGDRDAAERVRALGKPSITAWAVNHAWWTTRPTFTALLDAGERLWAAQSASLQGKSADVRAAAEARQLAVDAVVEIAVDALGGADKVSPTMRQRIAGTCDALATGILPPGVTLGRLTDDLQPAGFDVLSALVASVPVSTNARRAATSSPPSGATRLEAVPAASSSATTRAAEKDARARQRQEAAERARAEALDAARTALQGAESALRDAEADATRTAGAEDRARAELDAAAVRVTEVEAELTKARDAEADARRALNEATRAASVAAFTRARAARGVEEARRRREAFDEA